MNIVPTFLLTSTSPKYFGCVFCPDVLFLPWAVSLLDYARFESKQKWTPSSRIWTSDLWISALFPTTVHRSTNWAIEGGMANVACAVLPIGQSRLLIVSTHLHCPPVHMWPWMPRLHSLVCLVLPTVVSGWARLRNLLLEYRIKLYQYWHNTNTGDVAQMVERSLSMWEVRGSMPRSSKTFFSDSFLRVNMPWHNLMLLFKKN